MLARFPTASGAKTLAVHVPDGAYLGNVMPQDHVPFCRVPVVGAAAVQLCWWRRSGDVNAHVAVATPARASVSVMVHVTL
jgi:hypothetical protein